MSELVRPIGHEAVHRDLVASAREGRLPHALLFEGPDGVGKYRSALWLAATLLCERGGAEPCLECGACKRVRSDSHADLFIVDARAHDQNEITIFFVAHRDERPPTAYQGPAVEDFLGLRAAEGRGKYVVVRDAHLMNEAAQNAFLKMLEEPRPGVHILLETSTPSALLQTVLSRVVDVGFLGLEADACEQVLWASGTFDRSRPDDVEQVQRLVRLSGGSPGIALAHHGRAVTSMEGLIGAAFAGERPAHEVAAELWDLDGDFPGKTPFVRRRLRAETILDQGLELLVDIERCHAGAPPDGLRHGEIAMRLAGDRLFARESTRRRMGDAWLQAREDLHLNLSPEGLIDRALAAASPR